VNRIAEDTKTERRLGGREKKGELECNPWRGKRKCLMSATTMKNILGSLKKFPRKGKMPEKKTQDRKELRGEKKGEKRKSPTTAKNNKTKVVNVLTSHRLSPRRREKKEGISHQPRKKNNLAYEETGWEVQT